MGCQYMSNVQICKVINEKDYDLQNPYGHINEASVADIHLLILAKYIVSIKPDAKAFRNQITNQTQSNILQQRYDSTYKCLIKLFKVLPFPFLQVILLLLTHCVSLSSNKLYPGNK